MAKAKRAAASPPGDAATPPRPRTRKQEPSPSSAAQGNLPREGRARAVIDAVLPNVDAGRFPVKRIAGESIAVAAHCFADGHDRLRVMLQWQLLGASHDYRVDMQAEPNDVWRAEFTPPVPGRYRYSVLAWVDHFESWRHELERRTDPGDVEVALEVGAALVGEAAARAGDSDALILREWSDQLRSCARGRPADITAQKALALDPARAAIVAKYADTTFAVRSSYELVADVKRAAFSSWYELFPRSSAATPGRHGTFKDVEAQLPRIAEMGFDVLYFPPIHPIGRANRKGRIMRCRRGPAMWEVPGPSARRRAATRKSCPSSARWRTSPACSSGRAP
jgi:starch synthase (maltosyl-transferring)